MGNWYQEANKSENEHIKNLVQEYNKEDPNSAKRVELKNAILVLMGFDDTPVKEEEKEDNKKEESKVSFPYTEDDVNAAKTIEDLQVISKKCAEEAERLEKTRLLHETFKEKIALDRAIWKVKRVMFLARRKCYDIKLKNKRAQEKESRKISKLTMKQTRFISLYRKGFSFSNITRQEDGVRKEELLEVIDASVIEACSKVHKDFVERWQRWRDKFLKKETEE